MTDVLQRARTGATGNRTFPNLKVWELELLELRRRINATRWPTSELLQDDTQGVQLAATQALSRSWATDSDGHRLGAWRLHGRIQLVQSDPVLQAKGYNVVAIENARSSPADNVGCGETRARPDRVAALISEAAIPWRGTRAG